MFCERCGNKLPENAKFCGSCGARIEAVQVAPPAAPMPNRPISPPTPPRPPAQAMPPRPPAPAMPSLAPGHAATRPPGYFPQEGSEPLSVGQYLITFLLLCVPLLNVILLFVWSFKGSVNKNKKNFARAALVMFAVMVVFWVAAGGILMNALGGFGGGYY